jgi:sulfoxide reductase catalytic subunit YedY
MFEIHLPRPWSRRGRALPPVIDEQAWLERRVLLKALGFGGLAAGLGSCGISLAQDPEAGAAAEKKGFSLDSYPASGQWVPKWEPAGGSKLYPAARNAAFRGGRPLTPEDRAATKNNFYEFLPGTAGPVHKHTDRFQPRPWRVEIAGLVEEPRTVDIDEIARIVPLEERIYRLRCVEAWSMVVPWTGVPMADFVRWCKPKAEARYVQFTSFHRPDQAPGQKKAAHYPWPYYEGLRLDEAMHPLALVATGIFGHGLPAQHGAPIRVIVPWKYGYKSAKSFVKVEFVRNQPHTFWSDLQPSEYPFLSNVDPKVPHPRWSQASEIDIATGDRIPTEGYNGYAAEVAALYR